MELFKKIWELIVAHPCMVAAALLSAIAGVIAEYLYFPLHPDLYEQLTQEAIVAIPLGFALMAALIARFLEKRLGCPVASAGGG